MSACRHVEHEMLVLVVVLVLVLVWSVSDQQDKSCLGISLSYFESDQYVNILCDI